MTSPKILVILPTLGDRPETFRETLESVRVQREEVDLTLVVVLPADAQEAKTLAAEYAAVIVDDPRHGVSAAINRGLAERTDEQYYAWIGDDDVFRPGGLRRLLDLLESSPHAVLAFGGCDYIDIEGRVIAVSNAGALAPLLLAWGPDLIPHPGTIVRLDALMAIGGFDEALKYAMDLDAFLKLRRWGKFVSTRVSVSGFRWHPDSLTVANRRNSSLESEAVKRRHLPNILQPVSGLWQRPIRWASATAARNLNFRARKIAAAFAEPTG